MDKILYLMIGSFIGSFIGGAIGVGFMCMFQINKICGSQPTLTDRKDGDENEKNS